jgi:superfamily I DNA and RNA helicase
MSSYPSIFNDVIGPEMRGPSSSHCAASLRIARICRDLMDEDIKDILIEFDPNGSLATTHKSQGSEYPAVVIPVMTQHYAMLQRNLIYTGVTRGKKLVVLVGQKKAVAMAVKNVSGRRRWSKLDEWLGGNLTA